MNWELRMILVTLLVAAASAAPINPAVPCAHGVAAVAYAAAPVPYPAALTYAVPEPVQVAVQPEITYDFPALIAKPAPTPVKVEYDILGPIAAPAPAPVIRVAAPVKVEYIILPRISAPAPAPVVVAAPAPISVVPQAFETRVHYAETPVVVGHTSTIMKPNLGAGAHVTNFDFMGLAQTKTVGQESFVQKSKVLAPARSVSEITPQVTVQHPTKVNVEKFAVEVPVAAPYAQPVPVAPQYEIHQ
ncbi:calphotin-like [Daphnia pulicaria]|uniref:calphotin-like n=1 Tax=Daphnia pulicaria TaxID=35523 RepID=UPI001EE9C8D7|nr:calphotin-like [Daphnia pulicaria]